MTASIPVLRRGSRGRHVGVLQTFLYGRGHYKGAIDNAFGPKTERAVRAFQRAVGAGVDGIVGNQTWGHAMAAGLELVESPQGDKRREDSAAWPPPPSDLRPLYGRRRETLFGHIAFEHRPTPRNREAIVITNDWQKDNLTRIRIPQLATLAAEGAGRGFPASGNVFCHRLAAEPLRQLWQAWEDAGLLRLVQSYQGCWVPRLVRGSKTTLSNHAYGTAIDINYAWNMLGHRPALRGEIGSVRELVPLANELGFYWGGHFKRNDGMHFELVRLG